jgi:glycosyltransferase involved in cell wall biosynthesis
MPEATDQNESPEASFVTCVSDWQMYERCVVDSLNRMHFPEQKIERVPVDNVNNNFSASQALNRGLWKSRGKIIVFCHQDIIFPENWLSDLIVKIEELDQQVASWGVIGPAGRCVDGSKSGHILDPHGELFHPPFPRQVQTLDELCMIIRGKSELRFDEYFDHFHLYGADLCLMAACRGMPCYTVDCYLEHLSGGNKNEAWRLQKEKFIIKWWPKRRIVGKKIYTTSGKIRLHSPSVRLIRRIKRLFAK